MTTKGTWHRPEAEPGAYASGYDRIFGKREWQEDTDDSGTCTEQPDGSESEGGS